MLIRWCGLILLVIASLGLGCGAVGSHGLSEGIDGGERHVESIFPGEDIQARVNAAPVGTTFLLKAGVHRMQAIVPRDGDTFMGEAGTVLSGARLLATLSRLGSYWGWGSNLHISQTVLEDHRQGGACRCHPESDRSG